MGKNLSQANGSFGLVFVRHQVKPLSFNGHRFPPDIIRNAVWLYFRFSLSLRDVEELLAQRGIDVSYETIRCWTIKFGPLTARRLRKLRPAPLPALALR